MNDASPRGMQARYLQEAAQRRALHNQLVDLKGAIRVFCRVRPLLTRERAANLEAATSCHPLDNTITVIGNRYVAAEKLCDAFISCHLLGDTIIVTSKRKRYGTAVTAPVSCKLLSNTVSGTVFFSFFSILCLTVWGVEPVVTHQTSWLGSTGQRGVRQNQAGGSSVQKESDVPLLVV